MLCRLREGSQLCPQVDLVLSYQRGFGSIGCQGRFYVLSGPCITQPELFPFFVCKKSSMLPVGMIQQGCAVTFSVCDFHRQNLNLQSRNAKCLV